MDTQKLEKAPIQIRCGDDKLSNISYIFIYVIMVVYKVIMEKKSVREILEQVKRWKCVNLLGCAVKN